MIGVKNHIKIEHIKPENKLFFVWIFLDILSIFSLFYWRQNPYLCIIFIITTVLLSIFVGVNAFIFVMDKITEN